ncbi:glycoside hydrolase family protein [Burkholderia ubonensis]|uniref:glycoside hydrolase family protein n=1 Tax=Burkholderia ubonensis TaxID=101571 RepID=UPI000B120251|nr:hypothetical protein [Burkholderia ubonensis]
MHSSLRASAARNVTTHELKQDQFDVLVSYTYNAGDTGTRAALQAADQNNGVGVASHMNQRVYFHPCDTNGRRLVPVCSNWLVNRRCLETAPFRCQPSAQ